MRVRYLEVRPVHGTRSRRAALGVLVASVAAAPPAPATADGAVGVTISSSVNLRAAPGGRVIARLRRGTRLSVGCQQTGPVASGRFGPSRIWDRVVRGDGRRGWVADGFLDTGSAGLVAPVCGVALPAAPVPGVQRSTCSLTAPVALLAPFASYDLFIAAVLPAARASRAASGVPVAVTLAQAILETGGGRSTASGNNLFGLKAQATAAPGIFDFGARAVGCVLIKTREAEGGRLVLTIGAFRAYTTLDDSVLDHGDRLATNPVYHAAFAFTEQPRRFARAIAPHYATDPDYAAKLLELMDRYHLEALAG